MTALPTSPRPKPDFASYKTENLERISRDPRQASHHAAVDAILRQRPGHLSPKQGIMILTEVARSGGTIGYKAFYEACVGGAWPGTTRAWAS